MSGFSTIESGVAGVLAALEADGAPLLATVGARTGGDRRSLAAAIQRERLPAAYVAVTGRGSGGAAGLTVLLAARSWRDEGEARSGGLETRGVWAIAEAVSAALQDRVVGGVWRLSYEEERPAGGQDGAVVWEQRYVAARPGGPGVPTFGGAALAGPSCQMDVEVGELARSSERFAFPGVDGVFERLGGVRERRIVWRGRLAAAESSALDALEAGIEEEVRGGNVATMVDPWGRSFDACVVSALRRRGPRGRDALTGAVVQDAEIEFVQLGG